MSPSGPSVRRDVGAQVDVGEARALVQIDHAERVARVRISAMDAVAEDRHVGEARFGQDEQLVNSALEAVEDCFGPVGRGVQEEDFRSHLVDRDQAVRHHTLR
jgi:hypothetical protein